MKIIHPSWLNSVDYSIPKHVMSVLSIDLHISDRWFCTAGQTDASTALIEQYNCTLCGYVAVWNMHALLNDGNAKKLLWFKHTKPDAVEIQVEWYPFINSSILGSINSAGRFDLWNLAIDENNYSPKESKKPIWYRSNAKCFAWGSIVYLAIGGDQSVQIYEWDTTGDTVLSKIQTINIRGTCTAISWHDGLDILAVSNKTNHTNIYIYVYKLKTAEIINKFETSAQITCSNLLWKDDNLLFSLDTGIAFVWDANTNQRTQIWNAFTIAHSQEVSVINIAYCPKKATSLITLGTRDGQFSFWSSIISSESIPSEPFIIAHNLLRGIVMGIRWSRTGFDAILASHDSDINLSCTILVKLTDLDGFGDSTINCNSRALIYQPDEIFEMTSNSVDNIFSNFNRTQQTVSSQILRLFLKSTNSILPRYKIARFCVSSKLLAFATDLHELHVFARDSFVRLMNPIVRSGKVLALRCYEWFLLLLETISTECSKENNCLLWSFEPDHTHVLVDTFIPMKQQGLQAIHISISAAEQEDNKPVLRITYNDLRSYIWDYDMRTWIEYKSKRIETKYFALNGESDSDLDCIITFDVYE
ncbi:hypothetical protein GJ496_009288 [Pomphorhynchus laevis]|nr:hypothetical protein GJ496_009288 [Pomphorhynchus laevis]